MAARKPNSGSRIRMNILPGMISLRVKSELHWFHYPQLVANARFSCHGFVKSRPIDLGASFFKANIETVSFSGIVTN
jgi:hypothetical protein